MSHEARTSIDTPHARWHTSSYSGGQGDCVQVADELPGAVPVRDSKRPADQVIPFSRDAWRTFVAHLR